MNTQSAAAATDVQLVEVLFKTIKELCANEKVICDYNQYYWTSFLANIPKLDDGPKYIHFYSASDSEERILSVKKPILEKCPVPDESLSSWLKPSWDDYKSDVEMVHSIHVNDKDENFGDSEKRVEKYENWIGERELWVERQIALEPIRKYFDRLYKINDMFRADSEQYELLFAFGMFKDHKNKDIQHPLFIKKLRIAYSDVKNNIITIYNTEDDIRFDSAFLSKINGAELQNYDKVLNLISRDSAILFDSVRMADILKEAIHNLTTKGEYFPDDAISFGNYRFSIQALPLFIVRIRTSGISDYIDRVIDTIHKENKVPAHLVSLLRYNLKTKIDLSEEELEETIDKRLATVSGEDPDIYMTKPANKEQLRIAKLLMKNDAVEVQGPPGTGKTHTIANLLGNFLAQGKSVLVTSEKIKALSVLRDKLDPEIRPLCVPVLYDNKKELEHAVNAILNLQGSTSSAILKKQAEAYKKERLKIITELNNERRAVFQIRNQQTQDIVYDGKGYSVVKVAQFVADNKELLSYIPGSVERVDGLPLSLERFKDIYKSNSLISLEEEYELSLNLPGYQSFISAKDFQQQLNQIKKYDFELKAILISDQYEADSSKNIIYLKKQRLFDNPKDEHIDKLLTVLNNMPEYQTWQMKVIQDSLSGYEIQWQKLCNKIEKFCAIDKEFTGNSAGYTLDFLPDTDHEKFKKAINAVIDYFNKNDKIGKLTRLMHGDINYALKQVKINGKEIGCIKDAQLILQKLHCDEVRADLQRIWDGLLGNEEIPAFAEIEGNTALYVTQIGIKVKDAMGWKVQQYSYIKTLLNKAGFNLELLSEGIDLASNIPQCLSYLSSDLIQYAKVAQIYLAKKQVREQIRKVTTVLRQPRLESSILCQHLLEALKNSDGEGYTEAYNCYVEVYKKLSLYNKRVQFFSDLYKYAPEWVAAIRTRSGKNDCTEAPCNLPLAWQTKQFDTILTELSSQNIETRQKTILADGIELRKNTAVLASLLAKMFTLKRLEKEPAIDSALRTWMALTNKIGKGGGILASQYRKMARENMLIGQHAVPAWIMPVKKALEVFDPSKNHFDIIIVDEASQSSLEALAITFMADKVIVVGDDKQVSPMLVGTDIVKRAAILNQYLAPYTSKSALFDGKTSFYELVGTVYKPLMLKEHFRCVPEIIGYSNEKFYNGEILPLRDSNDCILQPPVINHRIEGRRGNGRQKVNWKEAETIVSLIQACCEQKEYEGKTFGVISLLGNEQADLINTLIAKYIGDYEVISQRELICGDSASFQGDERDVMFLSMVDDNDTIRKVTAGDYAKRYNVAASRAKDQLWVINSLDYSQLQQDDLHYGLLEYASNYSQHRKFNDDIDKKADSIFESEVAKRLRAQGYYFRQQYAVGSYHIDIVVECKGKKVAVECDGERFHSGEEKIRKDMERQCILERLGWSFIRIGGGQYFRDKEETMQEVFRQLAAHDIYPEKTEEENTGLVNSELCERVKSRAEEIRKSWDIKVVDFTNKSADKPG